ncbi:MAG: radical SAM protein [Candidatus Omnitrophica bacterium]|nr:radical SAM protein [Candidatus Omnitrophota bacterium]
MRYIYGPVKSRRLGLSLGITLTPCKICSFNCVYCQLGRTTNLTRDREEYIPNQEILEEFKLWLENNRQAQAALNYITLSGAGEPTLHIRIAELIREIKKITSLPLAVITNASLFSDAALRQALLPCDLIVPSLDAVSPQVFAKVDRPHPEIKIEEVIEGLVQFRREFKGKIWLEVMLVRGINDDLRQIKKLREVIDRINPDKIHLNSPVRATAEANILPVDKKKLEKIKEILGENCEVI